MATKKELNDINEGITNSEGLLDISNQILNSYNERKKSLKEISAEERLYFNTVSQQQRLSQQIVANSDKHLGFLIKSKDLSRDIKVTEINIAKAEAAYTAGKKKGLGLETKINASKEEAVKKLRELRRKERTESKEIEKLAFDTDLKRAEIQKITSQRAKVGDKALISTLLSQIKENNKLADIKEKQVKNLNKEFEKQRNIAESARKIIKDQKEAEIAQKKELEFLEKNLIIRTRIEKSTGLLGALSKDLAKLQGIGQYINAGEAIDEMEKYAAELETAGKKATDFGNRLKIAGRGITTLAKGFYENIKSPEAVFTLFINAALKANKESVNLSKNLGYGADNADRVRAGFANIERTSSNLNVTTANLSEAFNELSSATGFVTEYSADALETQIKLTKQLGLSGDEAAGIYELSVLNGKSSEATYQSMLKGYVNTRNSLKVGVPFKAAIAEAAKVSGQLAANMGYNAEKIVSGVVATRALGTSLEQAKSQGASLLEFQSSIENELQAELITGKQLNLEKARAAALMGDQVAVAEELAAQGMTATEFGNMNVIAQDAYAKALGTTSDELANQLKKREIAIKSGKSLAQVTADEADEAAKRQTIQEKFNAGIEKLQGLIGNLIAGPLGMFIDSLTKGLELITRMFGYFSRIFSIIDKIPGAGKFISGAASIATIGALIGLVSKSFLKGTSINPMIVKDVSSGDSSGGGSLIDKILGKKSGKKVKKGGGKVPKGGRAGGLLNGKLPKLSKLPKLGKLSKLSGGIGGILGGFGLDYASELAEDSGNKNLSKVLGVGSGILGGASTGAMIGSIFPGIGNLVGGIAGGAIGGLSALLADDMQQSGYGKRTILSPKGAIKLNDEDTIIAGTDLGLNNSVKPKTPSIFDSSMGDLTKTPVSINLPKEYTNSEINKPTISPTTQPIPINSGINQPIKQASTIQSVNSTKTTKNNQSPALDLSPIISVMNDVKSAIDYLNNKKWDVYLDSSKVGRGMVKGQTQSA